MTLKSWLTSFKSTEYGTIRKNWLRFPISNSYCGRTFRRFGIIHERDRQIPTQPATTRLQRPRSCVKHWTLLLLSPHDFLFGETYRSGHMLPLFYQILDLKMFKIHEMLFFLILYGAPAMSLTWYCHPNQYIVTYLLKMTLVDRAHYNILLVIIADCSVYIAILMK